jgi:hypothetical protein
MSDAVAVGLVSVPPQWSRVATCNCFNFFYTFCLFKYEAFIAP